LAADDVGERLVCALVRYVLKRMPAVFWNFSPVRCATVPLPGDAKLTSPGFALAAATRSASVLYATSSARRERAARSRPARSAPGP
jgi:hypothetical protein